MRVPDSCKGGCQEDRRLVEELEEVVCCWGSPLCCFEGASAERWETWLRTVALGMVYLKEGVVEVPTGWRIWDFLEELSYDCETLLEYSLILAAAAVVGWNQQPWSMMSRW